MESELRTVKEETTKQLQEAETILELEKQKLLKVPERKEKAIFPHYEETIYIFHRNFHVAKLRL